MFKYNPNQDPEDHRKQYKDLMKEKADDEEKTKLTDFFNKKGFNYDDMVSLGAINTNARNGGTKLYRNVVDGKTYVHRCCHFLEASSIEEATEEDKFSSGFRFF